MISAGVGQSTSPSAAIASREATAHALQQSGLSRAECAVIFATADHSCEYTRMLKTVRSMTGADHISGCSGAGVLTSGGEIERSSGIAVMVSSGDHLNCQSFLVPPQDGEKFDGQSFVQGILPHLTGASLMVLFPDIYTIQPTRLLKEIQAVRPMLPIVGGAASGIAERRETFQWRWDDCCESLDRCISRHAVSGMLFSGEFDAYIGIAQGCQPIGNPYLVTRSEGNLVYEIAHRPAVEILQEAVGTLSKEEMGSAFDSLFAGLVMDEEKYPLERGDYLVRTLVGVQPSTGAIVIAEEPRVGQTIQFHTMDRKSAHEELRRMLRDLTARTAGRKLAMGFYFNCLGRGEGLYGQTNHDIEMINHSFPDTPVVGFFGNAEFAPVRGGNLVHNYTGVLTLIAEKME